MLYVISVLHLFVYTDVLRDQIRTYREKFEISLQRVDEIDGQMKKYLDTQMNDPGPLQQQQGNIFVIQPCLAYTTNGFIILVLLSFAVSLCRASFPSYHHWYKVLAGWARINKLLSTTLNKRLQTSTP